MSNHSFTRLCSAFTTFAVRQACFAATMCVGSVAHGQTVLGGSLFVQSDEPIIATYLGNSATYTNDLYLFSPPNSLGRIFRNHLDPVGLTFNLGSFPIGTELIFSIFVNNTGNTFYSGEASRNPDNQFHTQVTYNFGAPNAARVEFEDLFNGPFHYNDLSFSFTNVPAPSCVALLGIGGLVATRRRR